MPSALKMLLRSWRSGQLNLLVLSLVVAVATTTGIALFTSAIQNSVWDEASHLLAGDAQIRGNSEIPEEWASEISERNLNRATALQFSAMAFAGSEAQLSRVKAVSSEYPLKGRLTIAEQPFGDSVEAVSGPKPGEVWITSRLFDALDIRIGEMIEIGEKALKVTAALVREPDDSQSLFNVAPRILIHHDDVMATGAVQVGSRIRYTSMLTGSKDDIEAFYAWVKPRLGTQQRWLDATDASQGVREALNRAETFLQLAGSLAVVLAGIAIAIAARRYASSQISQVALLKTLGLSPRRVLSFYLFHLMIVSAVGIFLGGLLGWAAFKTIALLINDLVTGLASPSMKGYSIGVLTGFVTLLGFAVPHFYALKNVTPMEALRQSGSQALLNSGKSIACGFFAVLCLVFIYSQNTHLTVYMTLATIACAAVALALAWTLSWGLVRLGKRGPHVLRLGLANLQRHRKYNTPQIMMFGMLFMMLFTLVLVRTSLIESWQKHLPDDAPNHFLFNIFPDERQQIEQAFSERGIKTSPFYPMVRGRLVAVNQTPVKQLIADSSNVNYNRELNLTWSQQLGGDNKILQGDWWTTEQDSAPLASIEKEFATGLGLQLNDEIKLRISGETVRATVANIRSVQWDSMNPNFYIILNTPILGGTAANWMASFYLAPQDKHFVTALARLHPTVSVLELEQTIAQIQHIVTQVSSAVEFIAVLILAAGSLVLVTSIQSTLDARFHEGAILRVLGASRALIGKILLVEFACIGLLSGLMACVGAEILVSLLKQQLFDLPPSLHWQLWLIGPILSTVLIVSIGLFSTRKVASTSPLQVLRSLS